jgi:predicted XRE-type DNA-binding protein
MRDIRGYVHRYAVTASGKVWSYYSNRWLAQTKGKRGKGYMTVQLWRDNKNKCCYVHMLVARAYIKNPLKKRTVNHKDGDVENNRKSNLEWATHQEQQDHAWATGLTNNHGERCGTAKLLNEEATEIKRLYANGGISQYTLAEKFGINQSQVSRIVSGARRANQEKGTL